MDKTSLEINRGMVEKAVNSFNWQEIMKFYKILGIKIGGQQIKIEGIIKKTKLDIDSIKDEVKKVLDYVIDNDIPEFSYGPWSILWVNGEWEIEIEGGSNEEEPFIFPILESKLQIFFVPQSTTIKEFLDIDIDAEDDIIEDIETYDDILIYEARLKKAIDNEEYAIASKLRDLIEELKKK